MNTRPFYFGLIFIAIIAILANYLGNTDFSHHYHISALIIAILLGMAIGNTIYPQFSTQVEKGVLFAKGTLSSHWHCVVWFPPHFLAILPM